MNGVLFRNTDICRSLNNTLVQKFYFKMLPVLDLKWSGQLPNSYICLKFLISQCSFVFIFLFLYMSGLHSEQRKILLWVINGGVYIYVTTLFHFLGGWIKVDFNFKEKLPCTNCMSNIYSELLIFCIFAYIRELLRIQISTKYLFRPDLVNY